MPYTGSISAYSNQITEELRQWGQGVSLGLVGAGLVNTNASGTINWASVTAQSGSGVNYGYDVFRFNDNLHNNLSASIFLRVEYCNRAVTPPFAQAPAIILTVGTTHNNSGTLGGKVRGPFTFGFTGGQSDRTPGRASLFAGGDGWLNMALWYDMGSTGQTSWLINIERTRDADGNSTAHGFGLHMVGTENGSNVRSAFLPYSGNLPPTQTRFGILRSPAGDPNFTNGAMMPGRIYHFDGQPLPFPLTSLMFPWAAAFVTHQPFVFQPYTGMNARYMKLGSNGILTTDNAVTGRLALRIE